jgi:NAD(P)H-nitrite reductase large subunit
MKSFTEQANISTQTVDDQPRVIVIGAGPAGIHFAKELSQIQPNAHLQIFSNEPYRPYNRVQLSAFLAGDIERDDLDLALPDLSDNISFTIAAIHDIDIENHLIQDVNGERYPYDKLVIATGARARMPNVQGADLAGVYSFRTLRDAEHLYARVFSSRHIVIAGGGLLGCESAKALRRYNTEVTLVQQNDRLMNLQLDQFAAEKVKKNLEDLGVHVITNEGVHHVHGETRVTGVDLRSGEHLPCDTVLFCAGIIPNIELAHTAELNVTKGILVSDQMQTSAPNVYAIGECCEHAGLTYGLVSPGYEQAEVAARHIAGETAEYKGSLVVSRLKVVGEQVCSIGNVAAVMEQPNQKVLTYKNDEQGVYRKIVLQHGKFFGALAVGEWPEMNRVQEGFASQRHIYWWQALYFKFTGRIWFGNYASSVDAWPEDTLVCQCNHVTRGQLSAAMTNGYETAEGLVKKTKAATVCGACKPLLQELCDSDGEREKETAWLPILLASIMTVVATLLIALLPESQISDSVQTQGWFEQIWNDKFYKQVTGFSLLGLSTIGLLMSLRKRLKAEWLGNFTYWRVLHIVLGVLCVLVLIFHSGFHLGENLNRLLILDFLGIILLGSTASLVVSFSHWFKPAQAMSIHKFWSWVHIGFTWPLPALLGIHILTVYYF